MHGEAIDWLIEQALNAAGRGEPLTPASTMLLMRGYVKTGRRDLSEALGAALAAALSSSQTGGDSRRRYEWVALFVEASAISEDERLPPAVQMLATALREGWPGRGDLQSAMRSVDGYLLAADFFSGAEIAGAIDELERVIGLTYEPGEGIAHELDRNTPGPGTLGDHLAAASALLTAYIVTGRLPYSMLAEELMQFTRREWWDQTRGGFHRSAPNAVPTTSSELFAANCEAARVLCRLARLHRDPDYRQTAVIAQASDYSGDATRTLESLSTDYRQTGADAALYGLALTELVLDEP